MTFVDVSLDLNSRTAASISRAKEPELNENTTKEDDIPTGT